MPMRSHAFFFVNVYLQFNVSIKKLRETCPLVFWMKEQSCVSVTVEIASVRLRELLCNITKCPQYFPSGGIKEIRTYHPPSLKLSLSTARKAWLWVVCKLCPALRPGEPYKPGVLDCTYLRYSHLWQRAKSYARNT